MGDDVNGTDLGDDDLPHRIPIEARTFERVGDDNMWRDPDGYELRGCPERTAKRTVFPGPDGDFPVTRIGEPKLGEDGRMYQQVQCGNDPPTHVPADELLDVTDRSYEFRAPGGVVWWPSLGEAEQDHKRRTAADHLVVLHSVDGKFATKRFSRHPKTGKLRNRSYDKASQFRVELRPVGNFAELAAALDALTRQPHAFVIRGAPLPSTNLHYTKRRFWPRGSEPATFGEATRRWFAVDMDHIPALPLTDPVGDPDGAVEHLIGLLPAEMHDASCWWQFTSSQSLPRDDGTLDNEYLSARLWFWSTVPLSDADLKRWAAHHNQRGRVIDTSLYQAVQAHYTCAPIFEDGMADPLPRRYGVRRGLEDEISLIIPPADPKRPELASEEGYAPGLGVEAYLAEIGGGRGFREPIKSAIASFIAIHGSRASAEDLKKAIRAAINAADPGGRDAATIERYKSDEHLDDLTDAIRKIHGDRPGKGWTPPPPDYLDEPPPAEPDGPPAVPEYSDEDLALRFALRHGEDLRFTAAWERWHRWDGGLWRHDTTLQYFDDARAICREAAAEIGDPEDAAKVSSAKAVAATVRLARADRRHAATVEQWDHDLELVLGRAVNGTGPLSRVLDLRTCTLREPQRLDYFTKPWRRSHRATVRSGANSSLASPTTTSICRITCSASRAIASPGWCTSTRCSFSTALAATAKLCSSTPCAASGATTPWSRRWRFFSPPSHRTGLPARRAPRHRAGDRQRPPLGRGEDQDADRRRPISARYMRQDFFEFMPQFKLLIAGNHKPSLSGVDQAMRRRLHLVPFTVTIPANEVDPHLAAKLRIEWPGILQWAVDGYRSYRAGGLLQTRS